LGNLLPFNSITDYSYTIDPLPHTGPDDSDQ
jgi:hypothetical protein